MKTLCMPRPPLLPVLIALLALGAGLFAFAACGDGDQGGEETPTAPQSARGGPVSTVRVEDTLGPVEGPGAGEPPALLTDVRTEAAEGADRIIFEFQTGRPSYVITYRDPPITDCGSGETEEIAGSAFLVVGFVATNAHNEAGEPTIDATELRPALPALAEAQLICDFEADVQWALGLEGEATFTVIERENPYALILEINHP